jgi:S1-C subfamily serine protease
MTVQAPSSQRRDLRCPACGATLRAGARFCGTCAEQIAGDSTIQPSAPATSATRRPILPIVTIVLAVAALALVAFTMVNARGHIRNLQTDLAKSNQRITALGAQNATLSKRLQITARKVSANGAGIAPLANTLLKSIFTITTSTELGTAWAAWTRGGDTYLITANHVVVDAPLEANRVTLKQKNRTWAGTVIRYDGVNDLAVVRVVGEIAPSLWQRPDLSLSPLVGDQLLLLGSPYGLEGTVTTGIVSRITYDAIQTDAAANPGNSGGPAVDRQGHVVGVLLAGGAENLNFTVPIQRACVSLRAC